MNKQSLPKCEAAPAPTAKPRRGMTLRRQFKRLAVLLVAAYVVLVLIAALLSDQLMFWPHASSYGDSPEIIKLTTADGVTISALHLVDPTATYTVLYSHGNGEDMGDLRDIYERICAAGFNVFAYDYHGYGTSGGSPTEAHAYADIDAAYEYLTTKLYVPPSRILVLGHSIGGGPSAELAARKPVGGLILESTFVSAFRTPTRVALLPWDKFTNLAKLSSIHCPVLVIHGQSDMIVPAWHGRQLYEAAPQPKQCFWVQKAGHNDLVDVAGQQYSKALQDFAAMVDAGAGR